MGKGIHDASTVPPVSQQTNGIPSNFECARLAAALNSARRFGTTHAESGGEPQPTPKKAPPTKRPNRADISNA